MSCKLTVNLYNVDGFRNVRTKTKVRKEVELMLISNTGCGGSASISVW